MHVRPIAVHDRLRALATVYRHTWSAAPACDARLKSLSTPTVNRVRTHRDNVLPALLLTMMLAPDPAARAQDVNSSRLPPGWVPPPSRGLFAEPALLRKVA